MSAPRREPLRVEGRKFHDGAFWMCCRCRRWGREGWPHTCDVGGVNDWFVTPDALRHAESLLRDRTRRSRQPFLASAPAGGGGGGGGDPARSGGTTSRTNERTNP